MRFALFILSTCPKSSTTSSKGWVVLRFNNTRHYRNIIDILNALKYKNIDFYTFKKKMNKSTNLRKPYFTVIQ